MDNIQVCGDSDLNNAIPEDAWGEDDSYAPPPPPTPKEQFQGLIAIIQQASRLLEGAYGQMIASAAPFDKELVKKLEGAKKADLELFEYVKSKVERGHSLPPTVISGLIGR